MQLHSQLDHPNVVKILKRFEDVEYVYMMIEYCPGGSLFDYVKSKGRLNEDEAREISYQIVLGLEYLHKNKVIHRDLKPGNILLTGNNSVKICDFGLAVRLQEYDSERDTFCGTPNYIAPEICSREPYGMKSDCWSFGCILYTIATGRPPFETVSIQQTLRMLQKKNKVEYPNHLSKGLIDLIEHILDWNSDTRYTIQQIKNHPFYNKCRGVQDKEYKLQNPMTFSPFAQQLPQQPQQNSHKSPSNLNNIQHKPVVKQRSNYSMDNFNQKNGNINKGNDCSQMNLQNRNINENKENMNQSLLNSLQYREKPRQNSIPLQKSQSQAVQSDQQTTNQSFRKESSDQNIELNRKKQLINDIQNQSNLLNTSNILNQSSLQNTSSYNYGYNPQINNQKSLDTSYQIPQKPQNKTILNTFLNKATKSNSLHQSSSSSTTHSVHNNQNTNQNNFFQSQKSYKNPIAQILNGNPQEVKTQNQQSNHIKNKSLDISSYMPQSGSSCDDPYKSINKAAAALDIPILTKQNSYEQPQKDKNISPKIQMNINLSQSSNNMMYLKDNVNSKMNNIRKKTSLHYPEQNNGNTIKQDILSTNVSCKNNNAQNMRFLPPPPPPQSQQMIQQQQQQLNSSILNYNNQKNTQKSSSSQYSNNNHSRQSSFDISQLKLDYSQMNSFSVERELQSTAQFSSKSNQALTPTNTSLRNRPPSNKNFQTHREPNPSQFSTSQSNLRTKGQANQYIRTEPCDYDVNQTPRLECLETEKNEDHSTAACSKYSISTTNRSFSKGLNTSKSFGSFIVDGQNENDKSQANIQSTTSNSPPLSQVSPIKVGNDLDIQRVKTKNGFIEITQDRSLLVESCNGRLHFKISKDGKKIQINKHLVQPQEKHYTLDNLPNKYYTLYDYAKQVVKALKPKCSLPESKPQNKEAISAPVSKLENKEGVFTLNEKDYFEAQFKTGYKVTYQKNSSMKIRTPDDKLYEISLQKNSKDIPEDVRLVTSKAIKYYDILQNQILNE